MLLKARVEQATVSQRKAKHASTPFSTAHVRTRLPSDSSFRV
jgi:hypothetical protein